VHAVKNPALPDQERRDGRAVQSRHRVIGATRDVNDRFPEYRVRHFNARIEHAYAEPRPCRFACGVRIVSRSAGGNCAISRYRTAAAIDMIVVVAAAGIGMAQDAQRLVCRHSLRRFEDNQANIHAADTLFAIDRESKGTSARERSLGRRQTEDLISNDWIAVRVGIHDPAVCANQAADFETAKIAQSVQGLGRCRFNRIPKSLQGQRGQRHDRHAHLRGRRSGHQCRRQDIAHRAWHMNSRFACGPCLPFPGRISSTDTMNGRNIVSRTSIS
jgi:hypothetical protein